MGNLDKVHPYLNLPEEESGAPAEDLETIRAGLTSPVDHIARLKSSRDPALIQRAEEWERALAEGKNFPESSQEISPTGIKELWGSLPKFGFYATGGTSFGERRHEGDMQINIPEGLLWDYTYAFPDKAGYGVGSAGNEKFLILRKKTNLEDRGGRPTTVLLDFGDEIWRAVRWNYALIIQKILENKELENKILNQPELVSKEDFRVLADANWQTSRSSDQKLVSIVRHAANNEKTFVGKKAMQWPSPADFASALNDLSDEERKNFTWMIGATGLWVKPAGLKFVYDPDFGDSAPESIKN